MITLSEPNVVDLINKIGIFFIYFNLVSIEINQNKKRYQLKE
jgi:hypothetical protein